MDHRMALERHSRAGRASVSFLVPLERARGAAREEGWLGRAGAFAVVAEDALRFELRSSRTQAERMRARMRAHEIAGGLAPYRMLEAAVDSLREAVRQQVEASIWPDGRPAANTDAEAKAHAKAFTAAWMAHQSDDHEHYALLQHQLDAVTFAAEWREVFVGARCGDDDVSTTWQAIDEVAESVCSEAMFLAIQQTYYAALGAQDAGN